VIPARGNRMPWHDETIMLPSIVNLLQDTATTAMALLISFARTATSGNRAAVKRGCSLHMLGLPWRPVWSLKGKWKRATVEAHPSTRSAERASTARTDTLEADSA